MSQARKDANSVSTILGTSSSDGYTPELVKADPTTHAMDTSGGSDGTDLSGNIASRDQNSVTVLMAASSSDGSTPTAVYVTNGALLTTSN